jgi:hypothetical protein
MSEVSTVQQKERDDKKQYNRLHQIKLRKQREYEKSIKGVFQPRKTREALPRLAKTQSVPTDVNVFNALLNDLAEHPSQFSTQISMLKEADTVRWSVNTTLGFDGVSKVVQHYVLQIRPSKVSENWKDWLLVKQFELPSAGLGLFATRAIEAHQLVSLYGGVGTLTPSRNKEYTINVAGWLSFS